MFSNCPPTLDAVACSRWLERLRAQPASPWLHEEVARRMSERLDLIKLQPRLWANWEGDLGGRQAHAALAKRWPSAGRVRVFEENHGLASDFKGFDAMNKVAKSDTEAPRSNWLLRTAVALSGLVRPESRVGASALAAQSVQLLWSNMLLHGLADPLATIAAWHRALAVDGCLMFSALGVDTGFELRKAHAELGFGPAAAQLTDMHDWGDMLVAAGFAEPVMDMERLRLTYPNAQALLADWRSFGCNAHVARFGGLRTPRWRDRWLAHLERQLRQPSGELAITVEVIYGHAFKPAPKMRLSEQSAISMQDMRAMLDRRKP